MNANQPFPSRLKSLLILPCNGFKAQPKFLLDELIAFDCRKIILTILIFNKEKAKLRRRDSKSVSVS